MSNILLGHLQRPARTTNYRQCFEHTTKISGISLACWLRQWQFRHTISHWLGLCHLFRTGLIASSCNKNTQWVIFILSLDVNWDFVTAQPSKAGVKRKLAGSFSSPTMAAPQIHFPPSTPQHASTAVSQLTPTPLHQTSELTDLEDLSQPVDDESSQSKVFCLSTISNRGPKRKRL